MLKIIKGKQILTILFSLWFSLCMHIFIKYLTNQYTLVLFLPLRRDKIYIGIYKALIVWVTNSAYICRLHNSVSFPEDFRNWQKIGNATVGRQFWCLCFTLQKELIEAYKLGSEVPLCIGHGSKVMFNYSFPIYKLKIV